VGKVGDRGGAGQARRVVVEGVGEGGEGWGGMGGRGRGGGV